MDFQPNCDGRKQKLLHSQVYYDKYDFEILVLFLLEFLCHIFICMFKFLLIYRWGLKIKKRMGKVEQWAEKQGLELAAGILFCFVCIL